MMTWGQVAGTPLLLSMLDASPFAPAACDSGPSYRLPAQPRRELVSHELLAAAAAPTAARAGPRRPGSGARTPATLSGAGQQLAVALGRAGSGQRHSLGFELRASYGGGGGSTPRAHAPDGRAAAGSTPRAQSRTPSSVHPARPASAGGKRAAPSTPSQLAAAAAARPEHALGTVTDGLLRFAS
jgi:hypothetical protein